MKPAEFDHNISKAISSYVQKDGILTILGDLKIQTWCYTKKEIKKIFFLIFYSIEKILNQLPFLSNFSDHLLISFRRK